MPLPVIADVFRVAFLWDGNTTSAVNVLHFETSTLDETDLQAAIRSHLTDVMFKPIANAMEITDYAIIKLDGTSATKNFHDASPQTGGTISDSPIPNTGPVVSLHTPLRGPAHRGRIYLPGVAESAFSAGFISGADAGDVQDGWTDFGVAMALEGAVFGVASYSLASFESIDNISVKRKCGTQRRRQSRVA